jgi:hypothetical protein
VIEAYVRELSNALSGPKRLKSDLLTEARHSLVDATEAYEDQGLGRSAAERRAIEEFGPVSEVVPAYQAELGVAQSRRTAIMVVCVLAPQNLIWTSASGPPGHIGAWYSLLQASMSWLGGLVITASLLAMLASGVGLRYLGPDRPVARATGMFALWVAGFFALSSIVLTVTGDGGQALLGLHGVPLAVLAVVAPMFGVALSARRTLVAAV